MHLLKNKTVKNLHQMQQFNQKIKGVSTFKDILNFWNKEFKNAQMRTKGS